MRGDALLLKSLDERRRELGLSYELLSKRCGVSRPTVQRILSGRNAAASFANVVAIAESLGLGLRLESTIDTGDLERQQAERKAKKLVGLVQATSGLEGQAVDAGAIRSMVKQTARELLAGSKRRLWSEE
jgi:transcriptional regulator with XRE-family HTH domain